MNLYELTKAYKELETLIEEGGDYEEALNSINDAIEVKADNYAKVIRNMEGTIEAIKIERQRLADKKKLLENAIERLKDNLKGTMEATGKTKFKTDLFSFNIAKNGGQLPVVLDVDVDTLPDEFVYIRKQPNMSALGKYIEETGDLSYGHIGERGDSLRIK